MPYVNRENGKIVGVYTLPQYQGQEFVEDSDAGYISFLNPIAPLHDRLKAILVQLPATTQAQFGEVAAAIDLAIQNGSLDVATLELQALTLPTELEPVRQQMLQEIANGL